MGIGRVAQTPQVMERESFENEDIAKLLNENFVPIKIDRCVRLWRERCFCYISIWALTNAKGRSGLISTGYT